MNKVILMGRLTKDPEVRVSGSTKIARYTIAVDRRSRDKKTDFLNCVCFDKQADFAEKFLVKGLKILISGRIQIDSYTNRDGQRVFTTDIIIESQEFCEKRGVIDEVPEKNNENYNDDDAFSAIGMEVIDESELPFGG